MWRDTYLTCINWTRCVCVCVWRAEMNKKDSCHTLWLSHTHTRACTRVTAAVWPASSIFRQIRESDRLLSGPLIAGPLVPVSQSQQERATPNGWPLRTTTRTPHPGSPPWVLYLPLVAPLLTSVWGMCQIWVLVDLSSLLPPPHLRYCGDSSFKKNMLNPKQEIKFIFSCWMSDPPDFKNFTYSLFLTEPLQHCDSKVLFVLCILLGPGGEAAFGSRKKVSTLCCLSERISFVLCCLLFTATLSTYN